MTPTEYREILVAIGLTQAEAARLLGVDEGTARRWASDGPRGRSIPPPARQFLRLLLAAGISPRQALRLLMTPNR